MSTQPTRDEMLKEMVDNAPIVIRETKAGVKTTEFWLAVAASLLTVIDGVPLPEKMEGLVVGAIGVAYILSRGIAKRGVPQVDIPAS